MTGKFRVWNENEGKYDHDEDEYYLNPNGELCVADLRHTYFQRLAKGCIAEFFTDIKDRDDKDVYKGDIIKYDLEIVLIGVVKWMGGTFYIETEDGQIFYGATSGKIIDNIHENPELLKDGEQ